MIEQRFRRTRWILALGAFALGLTSCTGGGGGSLSVEGSISGGSSSLGVTNVYPSSESSSFSTPTATGRFYVRGLSVSIRGTCSLGTAEIRVNEGAGDYSERATCANDGTFTWTKTYLTGDQGDKTLNLQAYDLAANAITGATASVDVRVDNTAPAAPTLVAPASSPYDFTGSGTSFTVQLGAAGDVVRVTGPASVQLTFNSPNYEYVVPLSAGVSSSYTFYAYDLAGNQSAGTSLTISYVPAASLIIGGAFLGGSVTDSGTNYGLEATLSPVPSRAVDSGTSYILETGFNYIMNQVRAD